MVVTARRGVRTPRLILLILAVGQLLSPLFLYLGNSSLQADGPGEPPIVPAGYTFAIWAVIVLLGVAYAVWQVRAPDDRRLDDVAWPLAGVFAGFSIWLVFAATGPQWVTVVVFAAMLVLLLVTMRTARGSAPGRTGRVLLWSLLGVYTGWTGVAVWVNLATAVAALGAPTTGVLGTAGQLGILVAATVTACAVAAWTRGLLSFTAAAAWALIGAAIGAATQGAPVLAAAAVAGLVLLVGVTVRSRRRVL